MKNRTSRIIYAGAIVLFITALLVCPAIDRKQAAHADSTTDGKSLTRKYDVVIVKGQFLRNFHGIPIRKLALLGFRGGKLSPIPFQIDERDPEGFLVMTGGKMAGRDDDGGKLDANDELVFYVIDTGDRLPEAKRSDKIEIELTDPRYPDRRAWAYLAYFKTGKVPRSDVDYVNYDPSMDSIISKNYILGYPEGFLLFNGLKFPPSAGGNGEDIIDRLKLRIKIKAIGDVVNISVNEDDMTAEVLGWIDGPVRVMKYTENYVKIFDYFPPLSFKNMGEYYHYMHTLPVNIKIPFNVNAVIKVLGVGSMKLTGVVDVPGLFGGVLYTSQYTRGVDVTSNPPAEIKKKMAQKGFVWAYSTKEGVGSIFVKVLIPDAMYQYCNFEMLPGPSETKIRPPEDVPGEVGGQWEVEFVNLPPGLNDQIFDESWTLRLDGYFPPPGTSDVSEWNDIRDYPLLVDIRAGSALPTPPRQSKVSAKPPWEGGRDGTITDIRDRKIPLKQLAYFIGGVEVAARSYFPGERVTDAAFITCPLSEMKSITNYYVDFDKHTKTNNAMFSKITKTDGSALDLLGCKVCGWGGLDDEGRVVYYPNAQIKRIDFD
jgi:hypothetical protein